MEPIESGEDNLNLLLRDRLGRPLAVARHYLATGPEKVAAELRLVRFLARRGFPAPDPVPTRDGSLFHDNGAEPSIALFPFVNGNVADEWSGGQRGAAANMHALCREHGIIAGRRSEYQRLLEIGLGRVGDTALGEKAVQLHPAVQRLQAQVLEHETSSEPKGEWLLDMARAVGAR